MSGCTGNAGKIAGHCAYSVAGENSHFALLFWMLSGFVCVKTANRRQIQLQIPAWHDGRPDAESLAAIVDKAQDDRHLRTARNIVETAFPGLRPFTRAFRGYDDNQFFVRPELLHHLVDEIIVRAAIHWYATKPAHETPEWPMKQRILADPAKSQIQSPLGQQRNYEIPVGGVWRSDQHIFRDGRCGALYLPSQNSQHSTREGARQTALVGTIIAHRFW